MTLKSATVRNTFAGTPLGISAFSLDYQVDAPEDLLVTRVAANGTETPLIQDVHYSVSGAGRMVIPGISSVGAPRVTFVVGTPALVTGETLFVERVIEPLQETSLANLGAAYPATVEAALDRISEYMQQVEDMLGLYDTTKARVPKLSTRESIGSGAFDARSNRIKNLDDPVADQDAATKKFVQASVAGVVGGGGAAFISATVDSMANLPTPGPAYDGLVYRVRAIGLPDVLLVCLRNSNGTDYEWSAFAAATS